MDGAQAPEAKGARSPFPSVLVLGFATSAAMWAAGYVGRLPAVGVPAPVLLAVFAGCLVAGGCLAGRFAGRGGWWSGFLVGVIAGAIDLLVLASVLSKDMDSESSRSAPLWGVLFLVCSGMIAAAAAHCARPRTLGPPPNWDGLFALIAVVATLFLLLVGGLVTSYDAGLAVPDWPTSYGANMFLFPLSRMTGGIYFEHAHRLFASLVGLITFTLAVQLAIRDERNWVRAWAGVAFVLVAAQGVMGGLRVTEAAGGGENFASVLLRVVHGITAQVFLAVLVLLAAFTSHTWRTARFPGPPDAGRDLRRVEWLVGLLAVQLCLGALVRHVGLEPWYFPHLLVALVVLMSTVFVAQRARTLGAVHPVLLSCGQALFGLVLLQFLLGVAAFLVRYGKPARGDLGIVLGTAHQITGAGLLAVAVLLLAWLHRLLGPPAGRAEAQHVE